MSIPLRPLSCLLLLVAGPLGAQQLRATPFVGADSMLLSAVNAARLAPVEASSSRARLRMPSSRSVIGTVGGAVVGAFLGYFASQVIKSDWEDEAGTEDNNRRAFAVGGAALGAVTGYALFRPRPEGSVNERMPRAEVSYDGRDRDLIVQSEIVASGATNAFDLVQTRRPHWLSTRGTNTFREEGRVISAEPRSLVLQEGTDETIIVYLDRARLGGVEKLREVPVTAFLSVRYYDARAATFRFGKGHDHGAIVLLTQ